MLSRDSYYSEYQRQRFAQHSAEAKKSGSGLNLLTDRTAYISYLEVQLDRVSAACMTVQAFSDRIQEVQEHTGTVEGRLQSLAQEVKTSKIDSACAVEQILDSSTQLESRMNEAEEKCRNVDTKLHSLLCNIPDLETHIQGIISAKMTAITTLSDQVELKLEKMLDQRLQGYTDMLSSMEKRLNSTIDQENGDLLSSMKSSEKKVKHAIEKCEADMGSRFLQTKQDIITDLKDSITESSRKESRCLLEKQSTRLERLESQIEFFRANISEQISNMHHGLQQLEQELKDVDKRTSIAEQTCTRLAHDALKKVELHRLQARSSDHKSFEAEMRAEFNRREQAMAVLIQDTERQLKKLATLFPVPTTGVQVNSIDPEKINSLIEASVSNQVHNVLHARLDDFLTKNDKLMNAKSCPDPSKTTADLMYNDFRRSVSSPKSTPSKRHFSHVRSSTADSPLSLSHCNNFLRNGSINDVVATIDQLDRDSDIHRNETTKPKTFKRTGSVSCKPTSNRRRIPNGITPARRKAAGTAGKHSESFWH